jgi:hypothetical protein
MSDKTQEMSDKIIAYMQPNKPHVLYNSCIIWLLVSSSVLKE